jgi:hypothetical protein
MSMKKTDLEKHLAKKLDGRMKSSAVPQRFGKASAAAAGSSDRKAGKAAAKLVPLACRLPAELVTRLRERAVGFEGGMSAVLAQAVEQWLASAASASSAAPPRTA